MRARGRRYAVKILTVTELDQPNKGAGFESIFPSRQVALGSKTVWTGRAKFRTRQSHNKRTENGNRKNSYSLRSERKKICVSGSVNAAGSCPHRNRGRISYLVWILVIINDYMCT